MNCKPGDLAILIRSSAGNEGKIVRCLELFQQHSRIRPDGTRVVGPTWRTDNTHLKGWDGKLNPMVPDEFLRPIRDPGEDAKDEMLRPLPKKETA